MKKKKTPAGNPGLVVEQVTTTVHPRILAYIRWRRKEYGEQLSQVISSVYLERLESDDKYRQYLAEKE